MNDTAQAGKLNDPQRRSLQNILMSMEQLVERSRELRARAGHGDEDGVLIKRQARLDDKRQGELKQLEEATLAQLKVMRDEFDLQRTVEDLRHKLHVEFSVLWDDLADERSASMTRYGTVDPDAAATLDPAVERLAELSLAFADLLNEEN